METFFPDDAPLRYWLSSASVSHIACSASWPPVIAVTGYAPCVRAWSPTSRDEPEFKPVQQLLEVDGERFVTCAVKGDLLVAADSSNSGRISIWDTATWTRQQTLTADATVTCLDASRTYIAAGTAAGYVRVWKRQSASDATFTQFFVPDLQLDSLPVYCVRLGPLRTAGGGSISGSGGGGSGDGGDAVMVVHTRGNGRVSAWRLGDAKIIGTLGRSVASDTSEALLSANVVHACLAKDVLLTCSWLQGRDPLLQWIHPIQRAGGEVPNVAQHLAGVARPLSCDYDGYIIVMGCEDGMVWVWGLLQGAALASQPPPPHQPPPEVSHWRGYHRGSVGAVACLPLRSQVASAGADGCVKLWSYGGQLLAVCRLGWQVTALGVNEMALVAGGAEGQVQILVLLAEDQAVGAAGALSRLTEAERQEAATAAVTRGSEVAPYMYWFDARSTKAAAAAGSSGVRGGGGGAGASGRASEYPDAFAAFVPPRQPVKLADLQQQQQMQGVTGAGAGAASAGGEGGGPSAAQGAGSAGTDHSGGNSNGKASSFNMQAALKGAHRSAEDEAGSLASEEEAKRAQLRAMGEGPGVARSQGAVQLEGATAALGRKCANPSCLQREGLVALQRGAAGAGGGGFKRCGACRSVVYCSSHCQSTHWRDGHKRECPQLAAMWRQQQQEQHQEQDAPQQRFRAAASAPGEGLASCNTGTSQSPDEVSDGDGGGGCGKGAGDAVEGPSPSPPGGPGGPGCCSEPAPACEPGGATGSEAAMSFAPGMAAAAAAGAVAAVLPTSAAVVASLEVCTGAGVPTSGATPLSDGTDVVGEGDGRGPPDCLNELD